jgi:hypothetical protein
MQHDHHNTDQNQKDRPILAQIITDKKKNDSETGQYSCRNEQIRIFRSSEIKGNESNSRRDDKYRPKVDHVNPSVNRAIKEKKADHHEDRPGHEKPDIFPVVKIADTESEPPRSTEIGAKEYAYRYG